MDMIRLFEKVKTEPATYQVLVDLAKELDAEPYIVLCFLKSKNLNTFNHIDKSKIRESFDKFLKGERFKKELKNLQEKVDDVRKEMVKVKELIKKMKKFETIFEDGNFETVLLEDAEVVSDMEVINRVLSK
ncbi:MAG: hypothetical protein IMZ52_05765 [Actinobacteria bacterium]|nr:hypothetical protein [Actinomycetota bacterium]